MAVGLPLKTTYADGDVYAASDVNDTNGTINANVNPFTAGKNKIINGDFGVWQRGTSFTNPAAFSYLVDRWRWGTDGTGSTTVFSRQTFTPGAAPVTGYEGIYFLRWDRSVTTTGATYDDFYQPIENVQTGANQTVTISFWAKAAAAKTLTLVLAQNFGSGGSAQVSTTAGTASVTTSWQRFTLTVALPSISGKTVGTGSSLGFVFRAPLNTTFTFDIWGVQLEQGSTATAFQTATGTIQGELAACQRYYFRSTDSNSLYFRSGINGAFAGSTTAYLNFQFPTTMRIAPTSIEYSSLYLYDYGTDRAVTGLTLLSNGGSNQGFALTATVASGGTQYRPVQLTGGNSTSAYIGLSAEL
jgi:hypothetical protein